MQLVPRHRTTLAATSGQVHAIEARRWIAAIWRANPAVAIEIQWCPAHKGVTGDEKADEWAKVAAEEPDIRGVEWLRTADGAARDRCRYRGRTRISSGGSPGRSGRRQGNRREAGVGTSWKKYKMPVTQKPDGVVAGSTKRLASRFYQLKTGHCLTGQWGWRTRGRAKGSHPRADLCGRRRAGKWTVQYIQPSP